MNTTYGWLYQHYAHPLLEKQRQKAREELEALCREYDLDPEQQISLIDQMEGSCSLSGAAAFSIGVYFGMQFASNPLFSELNKIIRSSEPQFRTSPAQSRRIRGALSTASTITPTSANTAHHMVAMPTVVSASTAALTAREKTMF